MTIFHLQVLLLFLRLLPPPLAPGGRGAPRQTPHLGRPAIERKGVILAPGRIFPPLKTDG